MTTACILLVCYIPDFQIKKQTKKPQPLQQFFAILLIFIGSDKSVRSHF